jgi:Cu+-exporting ATPase
VSALEKGAYLFAGAAQAAQTELDPICGMQVKMTEAAAFQDYKGKTYYFCSERCRSLFNQEKSAAGN